MEIFKSSADGSRNLQEFQICFIILNVVGSKELVLKTVYFTLESSKLKGSVASKRPAGSKAGHASVWLARGQLALHVFCSKAGLGENTTT